jgi:predicted protein tyrosine phosphatase
MKKYLFLCSKGENRSPTAARVARDIARERGLDIEMSYGGVDTGRSSSELSEYVLQYDRIFVMEPRMITERLNRTPVDLRKVFCLYIDDAYNRDDLELVRILNQQLRLLMPKE